jgi:ubiquinone biosynthesis protein
MASDDNGFGAPTTDGPADLAIGSFTHEAPWVVEPATMSWRPAVPAARWSIARQLPDLVRPRRLPSVGRMATVVWQLGRAVGVWFLGARRAGDSASRTDIARRLRIAAEHLGPTYIKLAQIISSGEGLFPEELVAECKKCRDQVPAEPFSVVRRVVEEELGASLESVFSSFDTTPLAAASIAQVHAATLHTGEEVVVKVQRPSVGELVHRDLRVMAWLAPFLVGRIPIAALANPPALVELFAETITEELDFRLEAENMLDVARIFAEVGQRGYVVPRPHPTLVTPRILVMERVRGFAFDDVVGMKDAGVDTEEVIRIGMKGFMEGAMLFGVFHGDLHGGNLMVLPDGRVALLDFGITARFSPLKQNAFLRLIVGATMNDIRGQLAALRDLGALPPDTDLDAVISDLGLDGPPVDPTTLSPDEMVGEIQRLVKALMGYGARLPKELMLYIKNLVFLDGAIATLAPDLDLFAEIATISEYMATRHGERIAASIGMDADTMAFDFTGIKASFGVNPNETSSLTYRDLQERREVIRSRLAGRKLL